MSYGLSCVCPSDSGSFSGNARYLQQGCSAATQCVNAEALPQQELEAAFTGGFKLIQAGKGRLDLASGVLDAVNFAEAQGLLTNPWTVWWPDAREGSMWMEVPCAHSQPWSSSFRRAQIVHVLQAPAFMSSLFVSILNTTLNKLRLPTRPYYLSLCLHSSLAASARLNILSIYLLEVLFVCHISTHSETPVHEPTSPQPFQSPGINPTSASTENLSLSCSSVSAAQIPACVKYLQRCTQRTDTHPQIILMDKVQKFPSFSPSSYPVLKALAPVKFADLAKVFLAFPPLLSSCLPFFLPVPSSASQHQGLTALAPFWEAPSCRTLTSTTSCQHCFQIATKSVFFLHLGFFT